MKRIEMFKSPQLDHVHKLHSLGRQLNVLKRLYEGYTLIIERLNHGPHQGTASGRLQHKSSGSSRSAADNAKGDLMSVTYTSPEGYGVVISPAASLRFERLRDRITLYALSEIRSCLDEKDSLMAMVKLPDPTWVSCLTACRTSILSPSKKNHTLSDWPGSPFCWPSSLFFLFLLAWWPRTSPSTFRMLAILFRISGLLLPCSSSSRSSYWSSLVV